MKRTLSGYNKKKNFSIPMDNIASSVNLTCITLNKHHIRQQSETEWDFYEIL